MPAIVEFVDIAGLVAGASKGEGLGNQFLAHIRETDAIVNVVRCFDDDNVIHVAGKVDPISDIEVIQTELCLADLATVEKTLHRSHQGRASSGRQGSDQAGRRAGEVPGRARTRPSRCARIDFSKEELPLLKPLCLITAKPAMFVGNVAEDGFENNPYLDQLRAYAAGQKAPVVAICAKTEAEMADMNDEDKADVPGRDGPDRAGPEPADPRRLQAARACRPTSPPASRKCAPGPSTSATPRRRRPA